MSGWKKLALTGGALAALTACDDSIFGGGHGGDITPTGDDYCAVLEIYDTACLGCHSAAANQGGLDLETDAWSATVGVTSEAWGAVLVEPGDSEGSLLYRKCGGTQSDTEGQSMPLGSTLAPSSLDVIKSWIDAGATQECETGGDDTGTGTDSGTDDTGSDDTGTGTDDTGADDTGSGQSYDLDYCGVQEVFADSCVACHAGDSAAGGLDLDEDDVRSRLYNVTSAGFAPAVLVVPGDASTSLLYTKSTGAQSSDQGATMPQGSSGVSAEAALALETWINDGAPGKTCP